MDGRKIERNLERFKFGEARKHGVESPESGLAVDVVGSLIFASLAAFAVGVFAVFDAVNKGRMPIAEVAFAAGAVALFVASLALHRRRDRR